MPQASVTVTADHTVAGFARQAGMPDSCLATAARPLGTILDCATAVLGKWAGYGRPILRFVT